MSWLKIVTAGTAVVAMSTSAACSPPASKNAAKTVSAPTTSASDTPSSSAGQSEQAALAAYTGMWTDYAAAAQTANYQDQQLTRHATGAALGQLVQNLYRLRQAGLVIKGTLKTAPTIVDAVPSSAPTQVDIKDCTSAEDWLEYIATTGKLRDNIPGGRHAVKARVTKEYDLWRVANYQVQAVGTC